MKLINQILFDGINERRSIFIGFENDGIKYVSQDKPKEDVEIISEDIFVTPVFIDSHSHIGMVKDGEPGREE